MQQVSSILATRSWQVIWKGWKGWKGWKRNRGRPPYAPPLLSRGLVTDTACNQLNLIDGLTVSSGRNPDLRRREAGWQGGSMMW